MIERHLAWRNKPNNTDSLGNLGDNTTLAGCKVGDVVVYNNPYAHQITLSAGIVCQEDFGSEYIMGLKGTSLRDLNAKTHIIKVVSHENLTDEILKEVNESIMLKEVEVKEMTQSDIEHQLGYKIKIVGKL